MKNKRLKKVSYISFPKATENYFCKYLVHERLASRKTIEAYRDAFISYMKYMAEKASYDRFTYEAMNSPFGKGAAEILIEESLKLLKKMNI